MPLTPPDLDRRRFDDLVAEARQRIPRYTPEWTNFNDSDPGMTLVKLHAWMTETILFSLNQVPDLNYIAFLNDQAVGVYHAGYSLANRTLDVAFIWLGMAGGPAMIAALERGGPEGLAGAAREQASLMAALAIPAAAGLALVARPLAEVMVGPALSPGAAGTVPWVALSALFAGVTTYYFHQAFTLARRTRLLLAAMAVPAVANLVLNLVLIPRYGLNGALWSTAASYALGAFASYAIGRRVLALPIPWDAVVKASLATTIMALAVSQVPALGGAAELFAKAGLGMAVYGLAAAALDIGGLRSRGLRLLAVRRGVLA